MMNKCFILFYLSQFGEFNVWWAPTAFKSKARALWLSLPVLLKSKKGSYFCLRKHMLLIYILLISRKSKHQYLGHNKVLSNFQNNPLFRSSWKQISTFLEKAFVGAKQGATFFTTISKHGKNSPKSTKIY